MTPNFDRVSAVLSQKLYDLSLLLFINSKQRAGKCCIFKREKSRKYLLNSNVFCTMWYNSDFPFNYVIRRISGLEVNFLVDQQSFAGKIFFHQQTGETTSKLFPFEMSMTIYDIKIRIDILHRLLEFYKKGGECLVSFVFVLTTTTSLLHVWETWMILTNKRLLVEIFLTRRLKKSLAFCQFASFNFEPWI